MDNIEKIEEAKNLRCIIHERELYSEERSNEASIEFTRLEVQIAVVLLGFVSIFWNLYSKINITSLVKIFFALSIFSLVGSLTLGLLHLKIIEKFWDGVSSVRNLRFIKWNEVVSKKTSFEEACAFQEGTKIGNGHMIQIPKWTWILQSILLSISIIIIFILSIFYIIRF